jgi:hypothetical protein
VSKTAAIDSVEVGNSEWVDRAEKLAVKWIKEEGTIFSTDTLWDVVREAGTPREPRAMGALVRRLNRNGLIASTREFKPSYRRSCHSRPVRVWRVV